MQIAAEPLERDVAAALLAYVDTADLAQLADSDSQSEAATLADELAQLESHATETATLAAAGKIRPGDFARYSEAAEARQRGLRAKLGCLSGSSAIQPYVGKPGALAAVWDSLTTDQQRRLIRSAFGTLTVDPASGSRYDFGRVRIAAAATAA